MEKEKKTSVEWIDGIKNFCIETVKNDKNENNPLIVLAAEGDTSVCLINGNGLSLVSLLATTMHHSEDFYNQVKIALGAFEHIRGGNSDDK